METRRTFTLGGKAFAATELRSGDLEISGHCVVWDGLDADGEGFIRGALREAIPDFLERSGALAWHHQPATHPLGRVLEMKEDDRGVFFRARVDHQDPGSPLRFLYDAIRRGTMRGTSVAGFFGRKATPLGQMIDRVLRLTEVSLTTHPKDDAPGIRNVVEVKGMMGEEFSGVDLDDLITDLRLLDLKTSIAVLEYEVADLIKERS